MPYTAYDRQLDREMTRTSLAQLKFLESSQNVAEGQIIKFLHESILTMAEAIPPTEEAYEVLEDLGADIVAVLVAKAVSGINERVQHYTFRRELARLLHTEHQARAFQAQHGERLRYLAERADREGASDGKYFRMIQRSAKALGASLCLRSDDSFHALAAALTGALVASGTLLQVTGGLKGRPVVFLYPNEEIESIRQGMVDKLCDAAVVQTYMVCPPVPYQQGKKGGYATDHFRDIFGGYLAHGDNEAELLALPTDSPAKAAINALQAVEWQVNGYVLSTLLKLRHGPVFASLVPSEITDEMPEFPADVEGVPYEQRTPEQHLRVRKWAEQARMVHGDRDKRLTRRVAVGSLIREAVEASKEEVIWFPWAFDSRGRMYSCSGPLSPQGSDLQKAMIRFRRGHPVTEANRRFFLRNLAILYGFDKAPESDLLAWVRQHHDLIIESALRPEEGGFWVKADSPFCFLAAAEEYRLYCEDPINFRSHLPIQEDGSCNGLQHLSAITRDEVGGMATNLIPRPDRQDIYLLAAQRASDAILADPQAHPALRDLALKGIPRAVTKRPTMALGYGMTEGTAREDTLVWLRENPLEGVGLDAHRVVGVPLAKAVWDGANSTVKRGMELLAWLKTGARKAGKETGAYLRWTTPDGFPAYQYSPKVIQVRKAILSLRKVAYTLYRETKDADAVGHANKFPPNFIHSLDATHLRRVINRLAELGYKDLAMIHDSFGCALDGIEALDRLVREEFIRLHQEDPVKALVARYEAFGEPPAQGSLVLDKIIDTQYSFR